MSRICSKFETKKSFTYIPHRIGTFFHLKFVLNRSSAKVQKESTKKQPCSLEAQLGSSLRRLLLQNATHAASVVVPWALGREKEDLCLRLCGRTGIMMMMMIMEVMSIKSNDHDYQGCISCGILVSGIGARGVSSEHMENMEMFSCSTP